MTQETRALRSGVTRNALIDIADARDIPVRDLFTEAEAAAAEAGAFHQDAAKRK